MSNEEIKEENTTEVESIDSTQTQEESETIELNDFEINMAINMNYIVKVGDEIVVKSLGYDNRGRLNLSRKEALFGSEKKKSSKEEVKENKEEKTEKKSRKGLFRKGE